MFVMVGDKQRCLDKGSISIYVKVQASGAKCLENVFFGYGTHWNLLSKLRFVDVGCKVICRKASVKIHNNAQQGIRSRGRGGNMSTFKLATLVVDKCNSVLDAELWHQHVGCLCSMIAKRAGR